jgi:thioredoxin reductase (NADPH)
MEIWDCIIVGSGSAGATAGIYTSRGCVKNLLLTGYQRGGLLTTTHIVENFPGIFPAISGYDLMEIMLNQAAHYGTVIREEEALEVVVIDQDPLTQTPNNLFKITTNENIYYGKTVIWATGSMPKKLGAPGESHLENKGVSYCATCDGFLYKDKIVAVVGGGNTAMEEALFLSNIVHKVNVIHRRDEFRGENILYKQMMANPKIDVHTFKVVDSIQGDDEVHSIVVKDVQNNTEKTIDVDGVFIAIGHTPNTSIIKALINLDGHGYVNAQNTHTNVLGFFVAGDVQDSVYRQAVTAASSGCIGAMEAIKYLKSLGLEGLKEETYDNY